MHGHHAHTRKVGLVESCSGGYRRGGGGGLCVPSVVGGGARGRVYVITILFFFRSFVCSLYNTRQASLVIWKAHDLRMIGGPRCCQARSRRVRTHSLSHRSSPHQRRSSRCCCCATAEGEEACTPVRGSLTHSRGPG